eukprot:Gb_02374 [translate_table: standard]
MGETGRKWGVGLGSALLMLVLLIMSGLLALQEEEVSDHMNKNKISALIVFGDSTVDAGNNNDLLTLAKSNHPPYGRDFPHHNLTGRFSNGFVPTDYVASMLGLMSPTIACLNPEARGHRIVDGVTFASAASGFYNGTAKLFNVLSLGAQLEMYKRYQKDLVSVVGAANASRILSEAIYVISTGSNDYLQSYYLNVFLRLEYNRRQFRNYLLNVLSDFLKELRGLGARRIAVVSLPPMGCLPSQITLHGGGKQTCVQHLNKEAATFNIKLKRLLRRLGQGQTYRLAYLDTYTLLLDAANRPAKYGFVEARRGCCGSGLLEASVFCNKFSVGTCSDASKYMFWDSFHPSDRMNFLLAQSLLSQALQQLFP